jgi:hypothetical protein
MGHMMKKVLLATCIALAGISAASAGVIDSANQATGSQSWSAWGGKIGFRWNPDLLDNINIKISGNGATDASDLRNHRWFDVRQSGGLHFDVFNGSLQGFTGGSLQMRDGFAMRLPDGSSIDLHNLSLRARSDNPRVLDIVSSDGQVWLYSDRIMFELTDNNRTLAVRAADVRISEALAARIGVPDSAGWEIGDIAMNSQVNIVGNDPAPDRACSPYPWPGVAVPSHAGSVYQADLFMQTFNVDPVGCQSCDGPGGANDGIAGFAPSSSLINNKNDGTAVATVPNDPLGTSTALYTANIAWYTKFSGTPPAYNAPYKNDQHPFLIWNLYRINADGSIEQVGRSGVKHAFLTINASCMDSCNDSHSLGLGCGDTYGTFNNDSPSDMGPRSEIIPNKGIWGRCGSIFDPTCSGSEHSNGNTSWTQRLQTHESQIDPAANPGATYKFESWYVARDDINIYNSMASLSVTPHYQSSQWSLSNQTGYRLGPVIDRWVDPTSPGPNAMNTELANSEGHAKVAVKATDNGNGTWTYTYAVMNLDYARGVLQAPPGTGGPDPRVISNKGFDSFSIPVPSGATVTNPVFRDGTTDPAGKWVPRVANGSVTWSAAGLDRGSPIGSNKRGPTLDWGTLFSFSVTVNKAPSSGSSTLHSATTGTPAAFTVATLVPGT